jgi:hypothetical protein
MNNETLDDSHHSYVTRCKGLTCVERVARIQETNLS